MLTVRIPATPYAVPYLIEMLECTLVQDKANIIQYCVYLLASFTEGFFCKKAGFDVAVEYPLVANTQQGEQVDNQQHEDEENDNDNPYSGIKHDIEKHLVAGLPVLLNALHDTDDAKCASIYTKYLKFHCTDTLLLNSVRYHGPFAGIFATSGGPISAETQRAIDQRERFGCEGQFVAGTWYAAATCFEPRRVFAILRRAVESSQ